MSLLRPRVRDDRGNERPVRAGWRMPSWARQRTLAEGRFVALHLFAVASCVVLFVLGVAAAQVVLLLGPIKAAPPVLAALTGALLVTLALPACLIGAVFTRHAYWARGGRLWLLLHRTCPSCWHQLAHREADPDGCTVCPECGAAWRLPGESSRAAKQQSSK